MSIYSEMKRDITIEEELEAMIQRLMVLAEKAGVKVLEINTSVCESVGRYGNAIVHPTDGICAIRTYNNEGDLFGLLLEARKKTE